MLYQPAGWLLVLLMLAVLVPFAGVRGYRLGGRHGVVVATTLVLVMVGTVAVVPSPWNLLALVPAVTVLGVVQTRRTLTAAVAGDLAVDHGGIALDEGTAELAAAGFGPLLAFRLTEPAPPERTVALLDPPATTLARVVWRPGAVRRHPILATAYPGGRLLVTARTVALPPPARTLAQGLPNAPVPVLVTEHRVALAWLAGQGHQPLRLDTARVADLVAWDWRQSRERVRALPWSAFLAMWWVAVRRSSYCRGPLRDQPDLATRLAAWRAAEPASPEPSS